MAKIVLNKKPVKEAFVSDDRVSSVPDAAYDPGLALNTDLEGSRLSYLQGNEEGLPKDGKNAKLRRQDLSNSEVPPQRPPEETGAGETDEYEATRDAERDAHYMPDEEQVPDPQYVYSVKAEDVDVADDLRAILGADNSLTEEFKSKAATVYQASVVAAANKVIAEAVGDMNNRIEKEIAEGVEMVIDKLDSFLDKIVQEWREDNKVAIQRNVRTELAESFLNGMKNLFDEHYIDVPAEKVDLVTSLSEELEETQAHLDREVTSNIRLREQIVQEKKARLVNESTDGLTKSQAERLKMLSEGVAYVDDNKFRESLGQIKEAYFSNTRQTSVEADDTPILTEEVETVKGDPEMVKLANRMKRLATR